MLTHPMSVNTNTVVRWDVIEKAIENWDLKDKKVLDVGSGLGFFSIQFKNRGADVCAVDIDPKATDFLKGEYQINTDVVDIENDNLNQDNRYDLVFIGEILEHVKDPAAVVKKCVDVLNPNGHLLISTPALEGLLIHTAGKELGHHEGPEKHERDGFFKHELEQIIEQLGMKVTHHSFCLFYLSELFMQLTKVGYILSKKSYHSQHDVIELTKSVKYKVLKTLFPVLRFIFRIEQAILSGLGRKGHCHIIIAKK